MEKLIKWMQFIFLAVITLIAASLLVFLVGKILEMSGEKGWDPLAFIGSILGGILAIYGVRLTIGFTQRQQIIDSFPKKKLFGDEVLGEMDNLINNITRKIFDPEDNNSRLWVNQQLGNFRGKGDSLLLKTAEISGRSYSILYNFSELLMEFPKKIYVLDEHFDTDRNATYNNYLGWIKRIVTYHDEFEREIQRLEKEFAKNTRY